MTKMPGPPRPSTAGFREDAAWTAISHFTVALSMLAVQVAVVRLTNKAAFGAYAAAAALASLCEAMVVPRGGDLALQFVGRFLARGRAAHARAAARRVVQRDWLIMGATFLFLALAALPLSRIVDTEAWLIPACALTIPAQVGYGTYKAILIADSRIREQAWLEIGYAVVYAVLAPVAVFAAGIGGFAVAVGACALAKTLTARAVALRRWEARSADPEEPSAQEDVAAEPWERSEGHAILRNGFLYGASQVDVLVLSALGSRESVAVYRVAKSLAGLPARVAGPVWAAIRPRLLRAWHARDAVGAWRLVTRPAAVFVFIGLAVLPGVWLVRDWLVEGLYGAEYRVAALPFVLLLCGTWLQGAVSAWFGFWVVLAERRRTGTMVALLTFLAMLAGSLWAGRRGALSVAIAVTSSFTVVSVIHWIVFWRALRRLRLHGH